jgi:hypothetical protein
MSKEILGIRVDHPDGHVSKYYVGQVWQGTEIVKITPDYTYRMKFGRDAYSIIVEDGNSVDTIKEFRGGYLVELTYYKPSSNKSDKVKILQDANLL